MHEGDIVVLRVGTSTVRGVGVIIGDYEWNSLFDDVNGWDLPHVRRVRWLWHGNQGFGKYALKWGHTIQLLDSSHGVNTVVRDWLESEVQETDSDCPLTPLPLSGREVDIEEIAG